MRATLARRPVGHLGVYLSAKELALAQGPTELAVLHYHLSPQDGGRRPAFDVKSFPDAVVGDVKVLPGQPLFDVGVNENYVGIAAWGR